MTSTNGSRTFTRKLNSSSWIRNGQYHVGGATIPQTRELDGVRDAALWVFSTLFDIDPVEPLLEQRLAQRLGDDLPGRTPEDDRLIDTEFGTTKLAGRTYYTSELLHAMDPVLYSESCAEIRERDANESELE